MARPMGINLSFNPLQKFGAIIGALKTGPELMLGSIVPLYPPPLAAGRARYMIIRGTCPTICTDYQAPRSYLDKNVDRRKAANAGIYL